MNIPEYNASQAALTFPLSQTASWIAGCILGPASVTCPTIWPALSLSRLWGHSEVDILIDKDTSRPHK